MSISFSKLKAIWHWLAEPKYAWLTISVIFVALLTSLRPQTTEPVIRLTGLVLQLLGVGTVIWGISETRALFGHPSFASKTKAWLGRFPLLRRNVVISVAGACHVIVGGNTRAYGTHGAGENPTLEARLEALEKNITLLHERITQTQDEMDVKFQKVEKTLKHEEQIRLSEDTDIRKKLETTGTGGVHISAIGAAWLFVGVILSTSALEIAELLK